MAECLGYIELTKEATKISHHTHCNRGYLKPQHLLCIAFRHLRGHHDSFTEHVAQVVRFS